jgi:diguanylate cyclase (GGDEF)-like protein
MSEAPQGKTVTALPALSLAGRLALAFALLALFAAGLTGYFAYRDGRQALVVTAKEQLNTATRVLGRRIALTLDGVERDLTLLAHHPDSVQALSGDRQSEVLATNLSVRLLTNQRAYFQVRLIAASDGREVVRVDRSASGALVVSAGDLQEKGHYPYVYETLALPPGGAYISPAVINHEHGAHDAEGNPSVQLAMQVIGSGKLAGKVLGVAVINLDLNGLFHLLAVDLPDDTQVFLANSDGDFLIHPDPGRAFAFDRGKRARVQEFFPATSALITGGSVEVSVETDAGAPEGQARIASFFRVNALPSIWRGANGERGVHVVLGLSQALSGVFGQSGELAINTTRNVLIAGIIAALLALLLSRAVTASLRQIEMAIARFGLPGAVALPTSRRDEIGALARAFSAMQEQINAQMVALEAQRKALDHEAQHDSLTGLANRRGLIGFLPRALARATRASNKLSLFFIDLDGFKPINDTYGHDVGDQVLVEVAARLIKGVRAEDFVARPGGDEFVVVCEGGPMSHEEGLVADKLIDLISLPMQIGDLSLELGASIGIACFPQHGEEGEKLMREADQAMYAAKLAGRGVWRLAADPGADNDIP